MIKLYFSKVKILAQRPTHISAVATVQLIIKTLKVNYYARRLQTNTASIILHVNRDSDCNGHENVNSEKQPEGQISNLI